MHLSESDMLDQLDALIAELSAIGKRFAVSNASAEPDQNALRNLAVAAEKLSHITPVIVRRVSAADWSTADNMTARLQFDQLLEAAGACRAIIRAAKARLDSVQSALHLVRRLSERDLRAKPAETATVPEDNPP